LHSLKNVLDGYMNAYPGIRLLNDTPDAMYLLFVPDYSFGPLYVSWPSLETKIYPEYRRKIESEIALQKHMLLSWRPTPAGYTRVFTVDNRTYELPLILSVPSNKLLNSAGAPTSGN
jgi:hypothetical protein